MTAIKPIENRRVTAVAAQSYPLNATCAHPECKEPAVDPHHAFPRSAVGGDSWFVVAVFDSYEDAQAVLGDDAAVEEIGKDLWASRPFPHVVGLCRSHHDQAEDHVAWIKLEGGVWNWLVRDGEPEASEEYRPLDDIDATWITLDALNPQPGSREGKAKRKRLKGEARRKRKVISVRVPDDEENGGEVWDDTLDRVKEKLVAMGLYEAGATIPVYEATVAAWNDWLNS